MKKFNTLDLILYWGKLQPSNQKKLVQSVVTNISYHMTLNGFLYSIKDEEVHGEWVLTE